MSLSLCEGAVLVGVALWLGLALMRRAFDLGVAYFWPMPELVNEPDLLDLARAAKRLGLRRRA